VIHVADERLIRLIALGKKTDAPIPCESQGEYRASHAPQDRRRQGASSLYRSEKPFGRDGNPDAEPLVEVMINSVEPDTLGAITEEEARLEGFASVEAFATYWDRAYYHKALLFHRHQFHPVWIVSFTYKRTLPAGEKLIAKLGGRRSWRG
jgi:hypothetical protein